jgi:hypothetical protein
MATATIPETVTVPGQVVYEALVCLTAVRDFLEGITGSEVPLADKFNHALYYLHETAFGPYHIDDDLTEAPLAAQAKRDGRELLRGCLAV